MGSSPASHPASWPGSMDTCCISPWSITVGSRDSPPTQRLRLLFLSSCWSPHLVPWPQKWRQELTPGNVLPLLLQVLWHVVPKLFSSGILVWGCVLLLPRPPWRYKCCKTASNHPPSGSAASAAPAPKQTLTGSSQSAVCPLHREHEKERKPWELCTGAPSMCPGQPKSWTAPQFLVYPEKQLNDQTQDVLSVLSVPWWALQQWEWLICHPGIPVPPWAPQLVTCCRQDTRQQMPWEGAFPDRKGIDYQSFFLPGRISLL